ncbi:glutamate--tRNA ligase [Gymnodinialimonas ceratoperidinii]|uniref:Glutamate--tRNA ligase n=1 Tax=Gymnodinialimonas ceratoperidinii TaxID=2856823 RepID=A0A8F6TW13_9RHOB|nr:glutamate--tRNA ligase [Gymnodinialimonas ceratoperidinii]QXT38731.1 glutamate--tRNA ligase [Gymnodinialimonas ceratoperidinii]
MSDAQQIVTRIAPSPTGYMHIGTARTALFNWLYARARGGRFVLRVEDTDRARSTPEATQAILDGLDWLGLDYDGEAISQFERADRHREVAEQMLAQGHAYKCFSTQEEIAAFREAARAEGRSTLFLSPWRDTPESEHPDAPFAIRLKAPREGTTVIRDRVQGDVTIQNATLDDMILLRSDGTPTYMHAVVVDDHDMGITHVIRGDDHLNNAARQVQIFNAMGWPEPVWAHIPLIHGDDGKKLSKRHGATGVMEYAEMGIPASAMRNYLARLGWSHGDDELFTDEQALEWFDLDGIGKSPSRLDMKKLANVTGWHIARTEDADLVAQINHFLKLTGQSELSQAQQDGLTRAMYCLKDRAKSLPDLLDKGRFVLENRPFDYDEKARAALDPVSRGILKELTAQLQNASWSRDTLEGVLNAAAQSHGLKFGKLAGPLRAALSGRTVSPSVYDMMLVIGRDETLARLDEAASLA